MKHVIFFSQFYIWHTTLLTHSTLHNTNKTISSDMEKLTNPATIHNLITTKDQLIDSLYINLAMEFAFTSVWIDNRIQKYSCSCCAALPYTFKLAARPHHSFSVNSAKWPKSQAVAAVVEGVVVLLHCEVLTSCRGYLVLYIYIELPGQLKISQMSDWLH